MNTKFYLFIFIFSNLVLLKSSSIAQETIITFQNSAFARTVDHSKKMSFSVLDDDRIITVIPTTFGSKLIVSLISKNEVNEVIVENFDNKNIIYELNVIDERIEILFSKKNKKEIELHYLYINIENFTYEYSPSPFILDTIGLLALFHKTNLFTLSAINDSLIVTKYHRNWDSERFAFHITDSVIVQTLMNAKRTSAFIDYDANFLSMRKYSHLNKVYKTKNIITVTLDAPSSDPYNFINATYILSLDLLTLTCDIKIVNGVEKHKVWKSNSFFKNDTLFRIVAWEKDVTISSYDLNRNQMYFSFHQNKEDTSNIWIPKYRYDEWGTENTFYKKKNQTLGTAISMFPTGKPVIYLDHYRGKDILTIGRFANESSSPIFIFPGSSLLTNLIRTAITTASDQLGSGPGLSSFFLLELKKNDSLPTNYSGDFLKKRIIDYKTNITKQKLKIHFTTYSNQGNMFYYSYYDKKKKIFKFLKFNTE